MNITDKLADALRTIDEHCQTGLNSSVYSHWSAALEDAMRVSREAIAAYDAQTALPANVAFAWGERSALSGGLPLVTMTQQGPDRFTVRYGMEVRARLSYSRACMALGAAIMHALACDSLIDNRTKAEARRDGDA